jgi:hypothetical protein
MKGVKGKVHVVGKSYCWLVASFAASHSMLGTGYNNCRNNPRKVSCRDIEDAEGAFEDLHVHITADTMLKKWMQPLHKLKCAIVLPTSTVGSVVVYLDHTSWWAWQEPCGVLQRWHVLFAQKLGTENGSVTKKSS